MKPKEINIGLFGFGTIGSGVVDALNLNKGVIGCKTGARLKLKHIVDIVPARGRGVPLGGATFGAAHDAVSFFANYGTGSPGFNRPLGIEFPSLAVDRSGHLHDGRIQPGNKVIIASFGAGLVTAGVAVQF